MSDRLSSPEKIHDFYFSLLNTDGYNFTIGHNPSIAKVIRDTWGWPVFSIVFEIDETPVAYFSAFKIGKKWMSLPHFSYSSLWINYHYIDSELNANGFKILSNELISKWFIYCIINQMQKNRNNDINTRITQTVAVSDLFNNIEAIEETSIKLIVRNNFKINDDINISKVLSLLQLKPTIESQLGVFSSNLRRKIRKSVTNNINIVCGGKELLSEFYKLYRKEIHHHGSFGLPIAFFVNLLESYSFGKALIFLARLNGRTIGCSLMITYLGYTENPAFATEPETNRLYTSYALHYSMIKVAIEEGCHTYSFGHSTPQSTVYRYKQQWNTFDKPIFLNSTFPVKSMVVKYQFLIPIVKKIPLKLVSLFDYYISKMVY